MVIPLTKMPGETPLQAILRLKKERPELQRLPMTYAGRLDPMAEGLLLILVGEECKEKERYLALPKEYIVEVAFGVETDSGDALGMPVVAEGFPEIGKAELKSAVQHLVGRHTQPYPAYSSKTVQGKPLFSWARSGKLAEIEIPTRGIEIFEVKVLEMRAENFSNMSDDIIRRVGAVSGDFRQSQVIDAWEKEAGMHGAKTVPIAKLQIRSSSGAYMRYLAARFAKNLGTTGFALSIKRISIGDFKLL